MKFFADTADLADIRELMDSGLLDGVTTNPTLVRKSGGDFLETVREIAGICPGPVSAEVVAADHAEESPTIATGIPSRVRLLHKR